MSGKLCTALVVLLLMAGAGVDAQEAERFPLVSDAVVPERLLPGEVAVRRSVTILPEGATMVWPERLTLGALSESSGAVRIKRDPVEGGLVRWTVTYPFTSWSAGAHELGPLEVQASIDGRTVTARLEPLDYTVGDVLLADVDDVEPSPAEPPFGPSRIPWPVIPLVPAAIMLLTGSGWWRSSRVSRSSSGAIEKAPPQEDPLREIREALGDVEAHPGRTLRRIASLVRDIPALRVVGVTRASTTSDVIRLVSAHRGEASARVIGPLLWSADALSFGRVQPAASDVDAWVRALLQSVDHV